MNSASSEVENGVRRDGAEEGDVNPGEIAVGAGEVVELGLLADPEDADGHDAHQKDERRGESAMRAWPEIALGVDGFGGGDAEIEDEQGHGYGEDAVAEGGEAFNVLSCNAVVERGHLRESSIGGFVETSKLYRRGRGGRGGNAAACLLLCLLVVPGRGLGWAQGSESAQTPAQSSGQTQEKRASRCAGRESEAGAERESGGICDAQDQA